MARKRERLRNKITGPYNVVISPPHPTEETENVQPLTFAVHALQRLVSARFRIILTLIAVFCVGALLCQQYQSRRVPAARSPLSQRAFAMCRAVAGSCDSAAEPRLYDEFIPLPGSAAASRRVWSVNCQTEGRHLNLLFNEKTGRICCAFGETRPQTDLRRAAGIATPEEALHIAPPAPQAAGNDFAQRPVHADGKTKKYPGKHRVGNQLASPAPGRFCRAPPENSD